MQPRQVDDRNLVAGSATCPLALIDRRVMGDDTGVRSTTTPVQSRCRLLARRLLSWKTLSDRWTFAASKRGAEAMKASVAEEMRCLRIKNI